MINLNIFKWLQIMLVCLERRYTSKTLPDITLPYKTLPYKTLPDKTQQRVKRYKRETMGGENERRRESKRGRR